MKQRYEGPDAATDSSGVTFDIKLWLFLLPEVAFAGLGQLFFHLCGALTFLAAGEHLHSNVGESSTDSSFSLPDTSADTQEVEL